MHYFALINDTTKLDIKHTFKDGELLPTRFYHKNRKVQEEYTFKCQSLHGVIKYYYEDGSLAQTNTPYPYCHHSLYPDLAGVPACSC